QVARDQLDAVALGHGDRGRVEAPGAVDVRLASAVREAHDVAARASTGGDGDGDREPRGEEPHPTPRAPSDVPHAGTLGAAAASRCRACRGGVPRAPSQALAPRWTPA